jgi:hypothetical protein
MRKSKKMFDQKRSFPLGVLAIVAAVLILGAVGFAWFRVGPSPEIKIVPAISLIGKKTPVKVEVAEPSRGLSHVKVDFIQGDTTVTLAEKSYEFRPPLRFWGPLTARDVVEFDVGRDAIKGLKPGNATIRVTAERTGTWLRTPAPVSQEVTLPVRLSPPTLQLVSTQTYVAQGGCEVAVYRVGEGATRDGIQAGQWWFPGFPLPGGGKQDRFAFFAIPYDMAGPEARLVAEDAAGNRAEVAFIDQFFPRPPKSDSIEVSDGFLGKVVPEIMSQTPEVHDKGSLLENYLEINRNLRTRNSQTLKDLAAKSRPEFLWDRVFYMMPNGQVMAAFADRRTYRYQGKEIDRQDHLGFDLAVTAHAPVPAANTGTVSLARYFGIYGNAVIIDHGFGVMSLYGHLASIGVTEGQRINRADIIGTTGQTGLAGGDHLHFTILLQGLPVNPVEWWDSHWIQDRIARKLGPAFRFEAAAPAPATRSGAGM